MARKLILLFLRFGRFLTENKFRIFCSACLWLLLITVLIHCSAYFLNRDTEDVAEFHHELLQIYFKFNGTTDDTFPQVVEATLRKRENKFTNEKTRILGFPVTPRKFQHEQKSEKIIYLATEYFSEWNARHYYALHLGRETFKRYPCPINKCVVTKDRKDLINADAILFHLRDLDISKFPTFRSKNQVWILYSMEPPWLEICDMSRLNGLFNWTMSYRNGSDVMIKYGFIGRRPVPLTNEEINLSEEKVQEKQNKAVWLVSNCCTDGKRENYIAELMKHFPVDVLGGCGKESCRPAESDKCYKKIEKKYKFYIAFENAICQSYVTEKLYNVFEYNIIPVVFGGADYNRLAPPDSLINALEFKRPKELADYLWLVSRNITIYRSYFTWKVTYRAYLQPWMCDLCEKLHSNTVESTVRHDLVNWWYEGHSCKRWTQDGLEEISQSTYAIPCHHTRTFY